MQSLLCKTVELYVRHRRGDADWADVAQRAGLESERLEAFQRYNPETILALNKAAAECLDVPTDTLMEDLGTWVCTNPQFEAVRRLIRFSGETFEEMLFSLESTKDRVNLAMPGLEIPELNLVEKEDGEFMITCSAKLPGAGAFLLGVLRAMADDYGALALVELTNSIVDDAGVRDQITVQLLARDFATPRDFQLGGAA